MTMSHLLKQTKKCCVKIIRKLSLNSSTTGGGASSGGGGCGDDDQSPTAAGVGLNNRITAKYVLHKNCTPTRCKIQPGCPEGGGTGTSNTSFDELRHSTFGWSAGSGLEHHHHHPPHDAGGFHPLAEEQSIGGESLSFRRSFAGSDDNIPETQNNYSAVRNAKNLPKKRTNITSNKNVNLRKCFRLRSKTFDTTPPPPPVGTVGPPVVAVTQEDTAPAQQPSGAAAPAGDVEVPDSQTLANNNSSSRLIGARLDKISKSLMRGVDVGGGPEEHHHQHHGGGLAKISKPLFLTSKKHRRSNYNHIDAADDDEDDECEEVVTVEELGGEVTTEGGGEGRWRRSYQPQAQEAITLTSSALMFSAGDRQQQPPFRPQQEQETTLTTLAVANQYHHQNAPSVLERLTVAETAAAILFEKVKYDRTKRYLIDQLTEAESTSLSGGPGSPASLAFQGLSSSCSSSPFHLAVAAAAAKSEDFVDPWRNYNIRGGASWDKVSKSPWDSAASVKVSPVAHSTPPPAAPPPTLQQPVSAPSAQNSYTPVRSHWNPFEYSPAHLARLAATGSTQQQKQQHLPSSAGMVEPKHPQYRPAFQVQTDVWENLNNKHYEIDTDVVWRSTRCSSRRTSASTVETWIDDETFDNSFNEELERRCATLQICE